MSFTERRGTCRLLRRLAAVLFLVLVGILSLPFEKEAEGAWRAQIVDKESGKPLEGVVIVAVWRKCFFITMNGCAEYYDSVEVVTGLDGRFVIKPRWTFLFPFGT